MKKMTKTKGIAYLLLSIIAMVLLGLLVGFGFPNYKFLGKWQDSGKASNIKLGLDLKGGVSVTYQVSDDNPDWNAEDLEATRGKLEKRVQAFSTEATAYIEGEKRITVEIPGETNAQEVINRIGKPGTLRFCALYNGTEEPEDGVLSNGHSLYVSKDGTKYEVFLTGEDVDNAVGMADNQSDKGSGVKNVVAIDFKSSGRQKFYELTSQCYNNKENTYIIYDDEILSNPSVNNGPIDGGSCEIEGNFTLDEAKQLASNIKIGTLNLKLDKLSHKVVGASLGKDALSKSLKAGAIGIALIIIFLLFVYRAPGAAAGLALVAYTELMLLIINAYDITLTLPGIAGIVLGIGMAVDANVIIYARIREEIAAGKTVKSAIKIGFQKATSAIVDGNITTFIAAVILILRGSGTVRGFGQTLAIGIAVSMFTALVISRGFVWMLYYMGFDKPVFYGKEKPKKAFDFIGKKYYCFALSIILAVAGIVAMAVNGAAGKGAFYYSIEFAGGTSTEIKFDKEYTIDQFNDEIKDDVAKTIGSENIQAQVDTETRNIILKTPELSAEKFAELKKMLVEKHGAVDSEDNFNDESISGTISKEMRTNAIWATVIATICMLIYIWFRFKNIKFAGSAVIALVHDVFLVVAFYAVSRTLVGTNFIACLLTLVGYSINATIVIFDRIRENKANMKRTDDLKDVVNMSITQTLTRSIYTSLTTFVMVFMIYIMGVSSIKDFTLPLMVGIIVGGYSSVFLTSAIWYSFTTGFSKKSNNK